MATSTFNTIPISDVIARAKMQLRISDTAEYDALLEVFCREGLSSLSALSQLTKEQCCLSFTGQSAKLPDNFVRYLALKVDIANETTNDPINNQLFNGCQRLLYADVPFLEQCGCDTTGYANGGFQIKDGYVHLNVESTIVDSSIAFIGLRVDANGKMIVLEKFERALNNYTCHQFTLAFAERYNQYVIEEYKRGWQAQRSLIIGRDVAQSFQDDKFQIQRFWNAWFVSPIVNMNV